jgi:hypothetical protein
MKNIQILILVPLDNNMNDMGWNKYEEIDQFINANNYTNDKNIQNGISGYLWGVAPSLRYRGLEGNWTVVLTCFDGYLLTIDKFYNIVKTKCGFVKHIGNIQSATKYMLHFVNDPTNYPHESSVCLTKDSVIGSQKWIEENKRGAI